MIRSMPARAAQRACTRPTADCPSTVVRQVTIWVAATMTEAIAIDHNTTIVAEPREAFERPGFGRSYRLRFRLVTSGRR